MEVQTSLAFRHSVPHKTWALVPSKTKDCQELTVELYFFSFVFQDHFDLYGLQRGDKRAKLVSPPRDVWNPTEAVVFPNYNGLRILALSVRLLTITEELTLLTLLKTELDVCMTNYYLYNSL